MKPDNEVPLDVHNSGWVTNLTLDFLKRAAKGGKPFFAFASFVDPHGPWNPPPPYSTMYDPRDMPPVVALPAERTRKPPHYQALYNIFQPQMNGVAYARSQYYGEVTFIDDCVGKLLSALDDLKLRDNTIVVFTSDHGEMLGDHYLFAKGAFHYRQCASIPLIINWPGHVRRGKVVDGIVQEIDILPTVLDLAGCTDPMGVQGRSQKSVVVTDSADTGNSSALIEFGVSGAQQPELQSMFAQLGALVQPRNYPDLWTLRTPHWRLSYYPGLKDGELYHLDEDPNEFDNLWSRPGFERTRSDLKEELLDRVLAAHDPLPARERPY